MDLGIIPDGNRRYAEEQGIRKYKAYDKAKKNVLSIINNFNNDADNIASVTFYLLSEENLNRDKEDLETLFQLFEDNIDDLKQEFKGKDLNVNWVSTKPNAIPESLSSKLKDLESEFNGGKITVNLLISYSGKRDILKAAEKIQGKDYNESNLVEELEIKQEIDFVIRTGDNPERICLSGFPIWNSSYAEFYHIKKNFPEVTKKDVKEALDHYDSLRRKKGE